MLSSFWSIVAPHIAEALLLVLPPGAAFLVAWLRAKAATVSTVKRVVADVERDVGEASGPHKKLLAMQRLHQARPRLDPERASQLIEQVLPEVKRDSLPPQAPSK
jgi:predicted metal-dependent hydrolase